MYTRYQNVFNMLNYLKNIVFNRVPEELWDRDLLIYSKLTKIMDFPFTEPKYRCDNLEFYIDESGDDIEGLICKEIYEGKIKYYICGNKFSDIKDFLSEQLKEVNKDIEIHTTDENIKNHILNNFNFVIKASHSKFYTKQHGIPNYTLSCEMINENIIDLHKELSYLKYPLEVLPYFGCIVNGEFVSVCGIAPINNKKAEVIGVRTNEIHRNQGYAKAVCSYAMNSMANHFKIFTWTTDENNIASKSLAESLGFKLYLKEYYLSIKNS